MEDASPSTPNGDKSPNEPLIPLKILIAGAGIGGLATAIALRKEGHEVHLYEKSSFQRELGAAIQMAPNANGLLRYLGMVPEEHGATRAEHMTFGNAVDGSVMVDQDLSMFSTAYKYPWQYLHRVDLHSALKAIATAAEGDGKPAFIHLSSPVEDVNCEKPSLTLGDGTVVEGDLIIGADGTHSTVRTHVLGHASPSHLFGQSCYRFLVPISTVLSSPNPSVSSLVSKPGHFCIWQDKIGHRGLVSYPCRNNTELNVVLFFLNDESTKSENWNQVVTLPQLLAKADGFHERFTGLFELARDPRAFQLLDHEMLETWRKGKVVLLGDAAHPFLPHQGQGGAQSIEDGVALATLLPLGTRPDQLESRLELFEKCRKERVTRIQDETRTAASTMSGSGKSIDMMQFLIYNFNHDAREHALSVLREALSAET